MIRLEVQTPHGLRGVHDTGGPGPVVLWHGGTPGTGEPPAPWLREGTRWIGIDRPGYGRSSRRRGRDVASVAVDVEAVLDHLGIDSVVTVGHSGGASHALACAALLPGRTTACVAVSGLAPYSPDGWFDGAGPHSTATLTAATRGPAAKEEFEAAGGTGGVDFLPADRATLEGPWGWFGSVVQAATADGPGGLVDDDVAHVNPWGFDPTTIRVPVRIVHGEDDRVVPVQHARRLAALVPGAEVTTVPGAGHLSVLDTLTPLETSWKTLERPGTPVIEVVTTGPGPRSPAVPAPSPARAASPGTTRAGSRAPRGRR